MGVIHRLPTIKHGLTFLTVAYDSHTYATDATGSEYTVCDGRDGDEAITEEVVEWLSDER